MKKKLPGIFPGKVKKNSGNNKKIFYSDKEKNNKEEIVKNKTATKRKVQKKNIYQKINAILNSPSYIYKADVIINLKTGEVEKRIVGKNNTHIITMENELIPITDIIDIKLKEK